MSQLGNSAFETIFIASLSVGMVCIYLVWSSLRSYVIQREPERRFYFNNGLRNVSIDPVEVMFALEADEVYRRETHLSEAWEGDIESIDICSKAARKAFKVPAFSSKSKPGLTCAECLHLLTGFYRWLDGANHNSTTATR
jgi:hypothetical protein